MQNDYVGTWLLEASHSETGEFEVLDDMEEYRRVYRQWLCEEAACDFASFAEAGGLTLTTKADGTFAELKTGDPRIDWYDAEGVLDNAVTPFSGKYRIIRKRAFLSAQDSAPASERIRYDDGDTKICDSLILSDGRLIRTVSVVTDELYNHRIFLRYRRA